MDGHKIAQSGAIVRFLAKRFNLNGKDEFEAAKAEEVWGYFYDKIRAQIPYTLFLLGKAEGNKASIWFVF